MRGSLVLGLLAATLGAAAHGQDCGETAVLSGCVGDRVIMPDCGNSYAASYTVAAADVAASGGETAELCLLATHLGLCPNTSAVATVQHPGQAGRSGDLSDGDIVRVSAVAGEELTITVKLVPGKSLVECIRLGEIRFALVR